jgi:hypothetical protein
MQFIVVLLLLLPVSGFTKTNWCEFNSDLAAEYMKARKNYAYKLKNDKAVKWNSIEDYDSGYIRAKKFRDQWEAVSLRSQVQELYGSKEVTFKAKDNGKLLIYPKDMTDSSPVIIMDPSGDYYRIVKAKVKNGEVIDTNISYTKKGTPPLQPKGVSEAEWADMKLRQTHFIAKP